MGLEQVLPGRVVGWRIRQLPDPIIFRLVTAAAKRMPARSSVRIDDLRQATWRDLSQPPSLTVGVSRGLGTARPGGSITFCGNSPGRASS
jgi:hypothetical protein